MRRAWLSALGASAIAAAVLFAAPGVSRLALARLFHPFGSSQWPKQTQLVLIEAPARVARGTEYKLAVGVEPGKRVPDTARVTYTYEDGSSETQVLRRDTENVFHGRIEQTDRSFQFTVTGNDDRTAPQSVSVVPPAGPREPVPPGDTTVLHRPGDRDDGPRPHPGPGGPG